MIYACKQCGCPFEIGNKEMYVQCPACKARACTPSGPDRERRGQTVTIWHPQGVRAPIHELWAILQHYRVVDGLPMLLDLQIDPQKFPCARPDKVCILISWMQPRHGGPVKK